MLAQKITAPYGTTKAHKSGKDRGADMVTFWLKDPRHYSISTPAKRRYRRTSHSITGTGAYRKFDLRNLLDLVKAIAENEKLVNDLDKELAQGLLLALMEQLPWVPI